MSLLVGKSIAGGLAAAFLESKYQPASMLGLAATGPAGLPQAFGFTPLLLSGMSFWILVHGFTAVNSARAKYIKQAKKDGETEVEERFGYPNLYAQGTSKNARAFNCVQRSHQQIFETFPQTCLLSMVGAVTYPIATAVTLSSYCVGRFYLSQGYASAEGDASKRYDHPLAVFTWYGFLSTLTVAVASGISIVAGKPIL